MPTVTRRRKDFSSWLFRHSATENKWASQTFNKLEETMWLCETIHVLNSVFVKIVLRLQSKGGFSETTLCFYHLEVFFYFYFGVCSCILTTKYFVQFKNTKRITLYIDIVINPTLTYAMGWLLPSTTTTYPPLNVLYHWVILHSTTPGLKVPVRLGHDIKYLKMSIVCVAGNRIDCSVNTNIL